MIFEFQTSYFCSQYIDTQVQVINNLDLETKLFLTTEQ